ncbi:MAG: beta-ketoacyl synthase N-terminal-like domain-containing protein, partial [Microthrixaceae bacterium]
PDQPVGAALAVRVLVALRAGVRLDQLGGDSIDDLVDGASSRRNQMLMDLGSEFGLPAQDGAHEAAIDDLAEIVAKACPRYSFPGPVLTAELDSAVTSVLGPLGVPSSHIGEVLGARGLGVGWIHQVGVELALGARDGSSRRGGDLGGLDVGGTADDVVVHALESAASRLGVVLAAPVQAAEMVDHAGLSALGERIDGVLASTARHMLEALDEIPDEAPAGTGAGAEFERLGLLDREHGAERAKAVAPIFDEARHVVFDSGPTWARADLDRMYHLARRGDATATELVDRVVTWRDDDPRITATARWYRDRAVTAGDAVTAGLMERVLDEPPRGAALHDANLDDVRRVLDETGEHLADLAASLARNPGGLRGEVVLVTGASPGSIAAGVLPHLLRGGATIVVATSSLDRERIGWFRDLEQRWSAPGARLHVVPANLASFDDVDALVEWLVTPASDAARAAQRSAGEVLLPTVVLPFAAPRVAGEVPESGAADELALRVLLTGVQRLVGRLGEHHLATGGEPMRVVLPLSPNHGTFGGDGAYGASKAALETLIARGRSEGERWGDAVRFLAPVIGWVKGTSLMGAHDSVSAAAEASLGIRTFSAAEMGALIAAMCTDRAARYAEDGVWRVDLSGGLAGLERIDLTSTERPSDTDEPSEIDPASVEGQSVEGQSVEGQSVAALPSPTSPEATAVLRGWDIGDGPVELPEVPKGLADLVVIVGISELGPWGSSATRHQAELGGDLGADAVAELAWRCGLVHWDRSAAAFIDTGTDEVVEESELAGRYRDEVLARCGIRTFERDGRIDPAGVEGMDEVYLDAPLDLPASNGDEAAAVVAVDPVHRVAHRGPDGSWRVRLKAGSKVAVPCVRPLSRSVGGQLPTGVDPIRHGVPPEATGTTDRLSLWNLVVTAEAFADAGVGPDEVLDAVHPSAVANTQGTGMGGMTSLEEVFSRATKGTSRSNDILQEALANVVSAHVNQSLVGGYGPMVNPVAACATAAVSLEEAVDKIRLGKARFVVAGGWDDLGLEGVLGFGDMSATAASAEMEARGLEPREHSRPGDRRRGGFVESQGGGTFLVTTGDVALEMGLPVRAVVGYASSFGDGIHTSIPAPGLGALGCARGGVDSPLATALADLGLEPDDVGVVSKHDTSTLANDPNEAQLHELIQRSIGRSDGAPLRVVSQKALTGHAKGGAAAWQIAGLCDMFDTAAVPGNPNLVTVDPEVVAGDSLVVDDRTLHLGEPLRAGLLSSLGFGHVSAVVLLAHPAYFLGAVPPAERDGYLERAHRRRIEGARRRQGQRYGRTPVFARRTERPERSEEIEMLLAHAPAAHAPAAQDPAAQDPAAHAGARR